MVTVPIANAVVAWLAAEEMHGRYSFIYGMSWGIGAAIGPYLAGQILDHYNPNLLWYACGVIGVLATLIFLLPHWRVHPRPAAKMAEG